MSAPSPRKTSTRRRAAALTLAVSMGATPAVPALGGA